MNPRADPPRERVTFSFGRNWGRFLDRLPATAIESTKEYQRRWLGDLHGMSFLDIGSGSGLNGFAAHQLGAASVRTFDADPHSAAATARMRELAGRPAIWTSSVGSILDDPFVAGLGRFDVVSSWGVLHHTGDVWHAIDNAASLVAPGGRLWMALYTRTYQTRRSLRTKRLYNRVPGPMKLLWRLGYATVKYAKAIIVRHDFRPWATYDRERGMSWMRDIEDWLGGLPYEPVGPGEVLARLRPLGFQLERLEDALGEGRLDVYLLLRTSAVNAAS